MLFLALEGSFRTLSVCIGEVGSAAHSWTIEEAQSSSSHSEELYGILARACAALGAQPGDFEVVLVGSGPGSFTGLRIVYSFAKGLAVSSAVRLYQVESFGAMALEALSDAPLRAGVADAGRGQLFSALFTCQSGSVRPLHPVAIRSQEEVLAYLADQERRLSCPGIIVSADLDCLGGRSVIKPLCLARGIARLGGMEREEGASPFCREELGALSSLEPIYVRPVNARTIAERRLDAGKG